MKIKKTIIQAIIGLLCLFMLVGCSDSDSDYDENLASIRSDELRIVNSDGSVSRYWYEQGETSLNDPLPDGGSKRCFCQRLAFRAAQALSQHPDFSERYPDGIVRETMQILTRWNTDGAEELFVDALHWPLADVRIASDATDHSYLTLADAVFYFVPCNTDIAWKVSAQESLFPLDFFSLRTAAKTGGSEDKAAFKPVKTDAMDNYLGTLPIENGFKVETVDPVAEGLTPNLVLESEKTVGVMVIAHGSDEAEWNQAVKASVNQVALSYPVSLGFLEFAEPDIQTAAAALEAQGADKIIAVPLFICSHSNHIEEIRYVLGMRDTLPETELAHGHAEVEEEELVPIQCDAEITLTPALDDAAAVASILSEHTRAISYLPEQEIAVLVGHGGDSDECLAKWEQNFASLAAQVKADLGLKDARYGFVAMGEPAVADVVAQAVTEGDVLVVPVMLSNGYFIQTRIPAVLEGMEYRYADEALLPDPGIAVWVEERVNAAIGQGARQAITL